MIDYDKVTSPYIRQKIQTTNWADRDEIDGLIEFERYLRRGYHGFGAAMAFGSLRHKYIKDYAALAAEISPEHLKNAMEFIESVARSENRYVENRKLEDEEEAIDRQAWKRAGGIDPS